MRRANSFEESAYQPSDVPLVLFATEVSLGFIRANKDCYIRNIYALLMPAMHTMNMVRYTLNG